MYALKRSGTKTSLTCWVLAPPMLNPAAAAPSPSAQRTFLAPPEPPPLARMLRSFGAASAGPDTGPRSCTFRRLAARLPASAASSASSSSAAHLVIGLGKKG
jgi:hypothetical protein